MGTLLALIFCGVVLWWAARWTVRELRNRPAPMPRTHIDTDRASGGLSLQQREALARLERDFEATHGPLWAKLEGLRA